MNEHFNGNIMTTAHFHDFYFMEAMLAGLNMAKSANPDLTFTRKFERLEADLTEAFAHMTKAMADRIAVYIWSAALGEARYAFDECEMGIAQISGEGRSKVYRDAYRFPMTTNNLDILKAVFEQGWEDGGYGGDAWLKIVQSLDLYNSIPNAAFIDYTVDLEHNGGNVFTKGARNGTDWFEYGYDASDLRNFLNFKFKEDILNTQFTRYGDPVKVMVSGKLYRFLTRYSNVIAPIKAIEYCNPMLEWLTEYSVEWGNEEFDFIETGLERGEPCYECGCNVDEYDAVYEDDEVYCSSCHDDKFKTCEDCNETILTEDAIDVGGPTKYKWVCETHASEHGYAKCEHCDEWTDDYSVTEDDTEAFCQACVERYGLHCELCNETYSDISYHDSENHHEDVEGFEETLQTVKIETNGGIKYPTVRTWALEDCPIFAYNTAETGKAIHGEDFDSQFVAYVAGKFLTLKGQSTLRDVQKAILRIKDIIDWSAIHNMQDWMAVPNDKIEQIKLAWYGG